MVTKKTGGKRGRPTGPVMDDPDRYALALFDAKVQIGKKRGVSERAVLKLLLVDAIGAVHPTPDNLARMVNGLPFRMWTLPLRLPPKELKRDRVEDERYRDAFAPYLDDLRRELRKLRTRVDARGVWHRKMKRVWFLYHVEGADAAVIDLARRLAASVGEAAYFEKELLPPWAAGIERGGHSAP